MSVLLLGILPVLAFAGVPFVQDLPLLAMLSAPVAPGAVAENALPSPFVYRFGTSGVLNEAPRADASDSPYFWLNSGGVLVIEGGIGKTQQGSLPPFSLWRLRYALGNALDTEAGALPQNIFRLVTRHTWDNFSQEVRVRVAKFNLTETPNRGEWSGILLMSRYQDGDNLYYAGIRMDGSAVIKKKYRGTYYTLATTPVFPDVEGASGRIPPDRWMGLRVEVEDQGSDAVSIALFLDEADSGAWREVLRTVDDGTQGGGVLAGPAYAGIRTDYLDALFDDYVLRQLP